MLATRHCTNGDKTPGVNKTNSTKFLCTPMSSKETSVLEHIVGMETNSATLGIKINGYVEVKEEDIVEVLGTEYVVIKIKSNVDYKLASFRKDFGSFTGDVELLLQRS